jgi:hypothetical protein
MKKPFTMFCLIAIAATVHAEWFEVKSVISYNQVVAVRPNAPANTIKIRIKNLENIEDIQIDRSKMLLSGRSALQLAQDSLRGQLVWIEDLKEESGIHVGTLYLSYEQMIRGYAEQRMVGGETLTPKIKQTVMEIYRRMLRSLDTTETYENDALFVEAYNRTVGRKIDPKKAQIKSHPNSYFSYDICYTHTYLKGIFVYEALSWFKAEGQFLPVDIQQTFVDWLAQYQNATDQRAKMLEMKIRDLTVRYELYKDFLFDD